MKQESEVEPDAILSVPELEAPRFAPQIPDDLMENLSKRDQHVLKTLSVMAQQQEWQIDAILNQNACLRAMERRQIRVERWKNLVMSRWGVFVGGIAIIGPYIVPKIMTRLIGQ
jgi:hypothetical protein